MPPPFTAPLHVLRLARGALTLLEQLALEEALFRADARNWLVLSRGPSRPTVVVGVSGRVEALVDVAAARAARVDAIRRFTGGGTVVADGGSVLVSFVANAADADGAPLFPRDVMAWSERVYKPVFEALLREGVGGGGSSSDCGGGGGGDGGAGAGGAYARSGGVGGSEASSAGAGAAGTCAAGGASAGGTSAASSTSVPPPLGFHLVEHDYCLGARKVGGNAQAVSRGRWVHHTSFLWDYDDANMALLRLPAKRPAYRRDRPHGAFLARLAHHARDAARGPDALGDALCDHLRAQGVPLIDAALEDALEALPRSERRSNEAIDLAAFQ